jgi:hypothetical protein
MDLSQDFYENFWENENGDQLKKNKFRDLPLMEAKTRLLVSACRW